MLLMQHTTDRDVPQNIAMQHPAISSKTRKEQARKEIALFVHDAGTEAGQGSDPRGLAL